MLRRTLMAAAAACSLVAMPAFAQVTIGAAPGSNPYAGPVPTYDFEGAVPYSGGLVTTGSSSTGAQPWGSTGNYWTVGPVGAVNTGPGFLDLSSFAQLGSISFLWGSVDSYNTLEVLGRANEILATFTGANVALPANGNQTNPATNPLVTLSFLGATQSNIGGLRLTSTQQAFEVDNFAVNAVPEPGVWAMLLVGFGFIGSALRGRKRQRRLRVNFA